MNEAEYIKERLDNQQEWHSKKSHLCQKIYKWLRFIELTLSAAIPVVTTALWGDIYGRWFLISIGLLLTIFAAIQNIWQFQQRGIDYRTVSESLKREKFLYLTRSAPYSDDTTRFSCLVEHVESIITAQNNNWTAMSHSQHKK